jgi:Sulfotransferase family
MVEPRRSDLRRAARVLVSWTPSRRAADRARSEFQEDIEMLVRVRLRYLVPVREPLVLISQIQRSGGTLLSQLFDDHAQVHAHPHELKIGHPTELTWPRLDLSASPVDWFEMLSEPHTRKALKRGYEKYSRGVLHELPPDEIERFPFLLPPALQREVFEHWLRSNPAERDRDVFDAYMTSYFNGWLDNQNLYRGPKKIVTGFTPRLITKEKSVAGFFSSYPDGKLVTIVRNPGSWLVSARKHKPHVYGDIEKSLGAWVQSTHATIDAKERYGDRVFVLAFEDLVENTWPVMERLAHYVGVEVHQRLLEPTFNGFRIKATSAFPVSDYGIIRDPVDRSSALGGEEATLVEERAGDTYRHALSLAGYPLAASR